MTVPTLTLTLISTTSGSTGSVYRPIWIHFVWSMTFAGGSFEGTMPECFEFIAGRWGDAEFIETCEAGILTFTPTGRRLSEVFVESPECSLFWL
jgi:hypothetical protein